MTKLSPSIKALVLDDRNNVLVLRKRSGSADLPGGRVLPDECDAVKSLLREVQEELSCSVQVVKRIVAMATIERTADYELVASVYLCRHNGGQIRLSSEHASYKWLPAGEIKNGDYPAWIQDAVRRAGL